MADGPGDHMLGAVEEPLVLAEGAGKHARDVTADGWLLRDDEGLGDGRTLVGLGGTSRVKRPGAGAGWQGRGGGVGPQAHARARTPPGGDRRPPFRVGRP